MDTMGFSDFAEAVRPLISDGEPDADYIRRLLLQATSYDNEDENPIHLMSSETLRKYCSGALPISGMARKIVKHLDKEKFAECIEDAGIDTLHIAYTELSSWWQMPEEPGFPYYCADLLESIIHDAARKKRGDSRRENPTGVRIGVEENYLLEECERTCPRCHRSLLSKYKESVVPRFVEVHLTPSGLDYKQLKKYEEATGKMPTTNTLADLILLCPECAADYRDNPTPEKLKEFVQLKTKMQKRLDVNESLDELQLEQELAQLLAALANLGTEDISESLNYNAVAVREKVPASSALLLSRIEDEVSRYYGFIKDQLWQLQSTCGLDIETIQAEIRLCYKKLEKNNLNHEEIFRRMASWISEKVGFDNNLACELLVSYFVQDCEVFDATSK